MNLKEFVCIDIETTGLNPDSDEVLEICAIKFDEIGQIIETFHEYCRPIAGNIPPGASSIHGITMEKIAGKATYSEIKERLINFIGKRTVIGHNIIEFDLKFLKIVPAEIEDTLVMCRNRWPSQNSLDKACRRLGIAFEQKKSHSAMYDAMKCIELYFALKKCDEKQDTIFDANLLPTQVYSFSRINLFHICPFKWKQIYINHNKEPDQPYLLVGKILHTICQLSAVWTYTETFGNRFSAYVKQNNIKLEEALVELVKRNSESTAYIQKKPENVTPKDIGMYLYQNQKYIEMFFGVSIEDFMSRLPVTDEDMELFVSQPGRDAYYNYIVPSAIKTHSCTDPETITEVMYLADAFYRQRDFTIMNGEIALAEQKIAFDKDWKIVHDWTSRESYMRFIIDLLEVTCDGYVTITDYKTGRKMLTEKELYNDLQMRCYALAVYKLIPMASRLRINHHYIRFGKTVSVVIDDIKDYVKAAENWIRESIQAIEAEMLKPPEEAFPPKRNEFCATCYFAESNICPLFNVKHINDINDVEHFLIRTVDDLKRAWKKIEVNKAEIKNLTAKAKTFVKQYQGKIIIDDNAILDFWVRKDKSVDIIAATEFIISKGIEFLEFLKFTNISYSDFMRFLEKKKITLSEEDTKKIIIEKTRTEFDALTDKEMKDKYLNV